MSQPWHLVRAISNLYRAAEKLTQAGSLRRDRIMVGEVSTIIHSLIKWAATHW